jgi:putative hydrolase
MATMGPMINALQFGSAVGHLGRVALGQYDLPVPRSESARILVVPANLATFAEAWSLPRDQVQLWVCIRELTEHAVLSRPHVAERIRGLLAGSVRASTADASQLMERLGQLDFSDPEALQQLLGGDLMGETGRSVGQTRATEELTAIVAVLLGYVEYVLNAASDRLLGGRTSMAEAWRRARVDGEENGQAAGSLLGLDLGPAQIDRGKAFIDGVIERAGDTGLARLWSAPHTIPTPSEVDAPGLWLERIDLTDDRPEGD